MTRLDKLMVGMVTLAVLAVVGIGVFAQSLQTNVQATETVVKQETPVLKPLDAKAIHELVNAERAKAGVSPLIWDDRLAASAQAKADDMDAEQYFAHEDPVTGMHGYNYIPNDMCNRIGENLISGYISDVSVVDGWTNSDGHYAAMIDPEYTHTGIAVNKLRVVQHFCLTK